MRIGQSRDSQARNCAPCFTAARRPGMTTQPGDLAARSARGLQTIALKRAQGRPGARCTRSLACEISKAHERSHYRFSQFAQPSPRNGFSGLLRALLGDEFVFVTVVCGFKVLSARLSRHHLRKFSNSNGCQDHTASPYVSAPFVLRALDRSRGSSRPATPSAPDAAASTASRPSVRDDGQCPSLGQDGGSSRNDLPDGESDLFLQRGLDRIC